MLYHCWFPYWRRVVCWYIREWPCFEQLPVVVFCGTRASYQKKMVDQSIDSCISRRRKRKRGKANAQMLTVGESRRRRCRRSWCTVLVNSRFETVFSKRFPKMLIKIFTSAFLVCCSLDEITASFRRFGPLIVDWPHKAESKSYFPPKGNFSRFKYMCSLSLYFLHKCSPSVYNCLLLN